MAKHKKLQQQQRQPLLQHSSPLQYSMASVTSSPVKLKSLSHLTNINYSYVFHDLKKTALVSSVLILVQLVLLFSLKQHILRIPGVLY